MRITGVTDALSYHALPDDGTAQERVFIWLCHINHLLPHNLQLSDTEIYQLADTLKGDENGI